MKKIVMLIISIFLILSITTSSLANIYVNDKNRTTLEKLFGAWFYTDNTWNFCVFMTIGFSEEQNCNLIKIIYCGKDETRIYITENYDADITYNSMDDEFYVIDKEYNEVIQKIKLVDDKLYFYRIDSPEYQVFEKIY